MATIGWYVFMVFETAIGALCIIVLSSMLCQTIEHYQDKKIIQLQIKKEIEEIIHGRKNSAGFFKG